MIKHSKLPKGLNPKDPVRPDGAATQVEYRFDLLPPCALFAAAERMDHGAKKGYERDGWKVLSTDEQVNHAIGHLIAHMQGDRQDSHLAAAIVRCMMAYETYIESAGEGVEQ